MTLKDYIKKHKLGKTDLDIYISLHNKNNLRFFGAFVNTKALEEYLDYEVSEFKRASETSTIYIALLPDYEYNLGLDSIRRQTEIDDRRRLAREKDQIKYSSKRKIK